ncbi:hypothetical protein CISIN_1g029667mg [Citrus sinensis]|uniref:Uncharacterized protein n=1 Tax=Citrus sinensis TaxID=2711 RepID=A0A067FEK3_CITSI|nr:hypothetical protein CISIN_1g029667mg [Citrus sinensis]
MSSIKPDEFSSLPQTTTTGILMLNYRYQNRVKNKNSWSSGLCDCFSDYKNCCITCWCPCMTFGQIAEIVDKGSSSCGVNGALCALMCCVTCCPCCYTCFYRSKMRKQYTLKKKPCCDCLVHCCCLHCALCQEHRELRNRGFDMNTGIPNFDLVRDVVHKKLLIMVCHRVGKTPGPGPGIAMLEPSPDPIF